uniref:Homeodomain-containing protein n=1 Tax=Alternaria alternata TaxID=5599 RepID=A0A3G9HHK9_ALTAL|nr:homeodomain-containing protein [Alternaria alternata]
MNSSNPVERPLADMVAVNHHMRSSPPAQTREQSFPGKLPSFSELLHTTRTTTPPQTIHRQNDSAGSSPPIEPQLHNSSWSESDQRRLSTLGDVHRPPVAQGCRTSSAIDPAFASRCPRVPRQYVVQSVGPGMHRYPSHSYVPPQQQSKSLSPHMRHHPSPAPQDHMSCASPCIQQPVAQDPVQQPMVQQDIMYEPRHSYYHESQAAVYVDCDRPNESGYARAGYPNYNSPYSGICLQQHVGLGQNAFNRKRQGNLSKEATNLLKDWFAANRTSPYPTEDQKKKLCNRTGMSLNQVSNWFINARRRALPKEQRERKANSREA